MGGFEDFISLEGAVVGSLVLLVVVAAAAGFWLNRTAARTQDLPLRAVARRPRSPRCESPDGSPMELSREEFLEDLRRREDLLAEGIDIMPERPARRVVSAPEAAIDAVAIPAQTIPAATTLFRDLQDFRKRIDPLLGK